jgi:uncharacterized protein (TIGR03083 family)
VRRAKPIAKRLEDKGAQTAAFFRALAPGDWATPVYADGPSWDVRGVLGHFVSAERAYVRAMVDAVQGGEGVPDDFDIDRFNAGEVAALADRDPAWLIGQFEQARAETVAFVLSLSDANLDQEGRHPFLGVERLEKLLKLIYRHNMLHERDVRRALGLPPGEG